MAKRSSDHDFMVFLTVAGAAVIGYLLYRHYEDDAAAKRKAVDTAPSVPDVRGGGAQRANYLAQHGPPKLV